MHVILITTTKVDTNALFCFELQTDDQTTTKAQDLCIQPTVIVRTGFLHRLHRRRIIGRHRHLRTEQWLQCHLDIIKRTDSGVFQTVRRRHRWRSVGVRLRILAVTLRCFRRTAQWRLGELLVVFGVWIVLLMGMSSIY